MSYDAALGLEASFFAGALALDLVSVFMVGFVGAFAMILLFGCAKVTADLIGKQVVESQKFTQPLARFYWAIFKVRKLTQDKGS